MLFSFSILAGFVVNLLFVEFDFLRSLRGFLSARRCGFRLQCFVLGVFLPAASLCFLLWLYARSNLIWFLARVLLSALVFHTGGSLYASSQIAETFVSSPERALSMLSQISQTHADPANTDLIRDTIEFLCADFITASALPILSMLIGGPSLGLFCSAVCVLADPDESEIAKKCSDLCRFWPSRLGAFFMTVACGLLRYDFMNGRRIYQRDRRLHPDAAVGQILSVCAGSLHICFIGRDGRPIGNVNRPVVRTDILRMRDLFLFSSWLMLLFGCFLRILFFS